MDSDNGSLNLKKQLTTAQPIRVRIIARDLGIPSRNTSVRVSVTIRALDGPPQFLVSPLVGHVLENLQPAVKILTVSAASVDPIIYKIFSGNEAGIFKIHPGTGEIQTTKKLDREEKPKYELVLLAADIKGRLSKGKVTIHVKNKNDNRPEILNSIKGVVEGQISLNAAIGSRVMRLEVQDNDGDDLFFSIPNTVASSYFAIDKRGIVRSRRPLFGLKNPYKFTVVMSDNGDPPLSSNTSAQLVLLKYDINQPELVVTVREDVPTGSMVTTVQPVSRVNNVIFSIISPVDSPFEINPMNGAIHLKEELDYESRKSHTMVAQVSSTISNVVKA